MPNCVLLKKESRRKMNPCDANSIKFRTGFRNEIIENRYHYLGDNRGRRARNDPPTPPHSTF